MIISCWSPFHQAGCTVTAGLLASYIAFKFGKKVLILDANYQYGRIRKLFDREAEDGFSQVYTYAHANTLNESSLKNHTTIIEEKFLYMLPAIKEAYAYDKVSCMLSNILEVAENAFDICVVDSASGVYSEHAKQVVKNSDIVVTCLPQDLHVIQKFFNKTKQYYTELLDDKVVIPVVGRYRDD